MTLDDLRRKWERDAAIPFEKRVRKASRLLADQARARYYLRNAQVGSGVRVEGRPKLINEGTLIVGDDCTWRSIVAPIYIYIAEGATMTMGRSVRMHSGDTFSAFLRVEIGDRVQIGPHVTIHDNDFHDLYERDRVPESKPVVIEDDVWLASGCTVLPGVRIGRGAVVAAHAVVNRDVAPFTVVAGVPAKPVLELDPERFVVPE
jgi:maltose O-acetyltransferase